MLNLHVKINQVWNTLKYGAKTIVNAHRSGMRLNEISPKIFGQTFQSMWLHI